MHLSAEQTVVLTNGPEPTKVYVRVEQVDDGPAGVRIQGAYEGPIAALDALQLTGAIQAAAVACLADRAIVR